MRSLGGLGCLVIVLTATVFSCSRDAAPPQPHTTAPRPPPPPPVVAPDAGPRPHPEISYDEICSRSVDARASSLPGKAPYQGQGTPQCPDKDPFCDQVDRSPDPQNACFVANDNIARAERSARAMLLAPPAARLSGTSAPPPPPVPSTTWDKKTSPKYLDKIDAHLHLTAEERSLLSQNGFVVLDRLAYSNYASAFHEVFQQQLPVFVSADSIFHALFKGTELALERVERRQLQPALRTMLRKLRGGLGSVPDLEARRDLDLILAVAANILAGPNANGPLSAIKGGLDHDIVSLIQDVNAHQIVTTSVLGRDRVIDFSQLEPRAHYAAGYYGDVEPLDRYFSAMMWLSRFELNIVSRDSRSSHPGPTPDPTETPREVKDALYLGELIERTGATEELRLFEQVYSQFAGKREDIPPTKLLEIARANKISPRDPEVADKIKAAIGSSFARTARTHFTIEGAPRLPAISTLFGSRIVPDVAPLTRVVHDAVHERYSLGAGDVGFVLGHDRARRYITDLGAHPSLPAALTGARDELRREASATHDIYGLWLRSVLRLADPVTGVVPSFMKGEAYADRRLDSALVAYGHIRHAFVLLAAQGYDAYGCEIPDGFVEPLPDVYDAMLAEVKAMRATAKGWSGLERVLTMVASIARRETGGAPLSEPEKRWLGMVSEYIPKGGFVSSGEPPKWTGWYFDMFEDREQGATLATDFIADYFTLTNEGEVAYLGGEGPRLGVFVVDTNGEPRAMVGPVAKGFERHAPLDARINDEASRQDKEGRRSPWRASYAAPERPSPALGLEAQVVRCEKSGEWRVAIRSDRPAGATTVELLDHHGDPLTKPVMLDVTSDWKVAAIDMPQDLATAAYGVEAVHLRVVDLATSKTGAGPFDYTSSPSVFQSNDFTSGALPERPVGVVGIGIGRPAPTVTQPAQKPAQEPLDF